MARSRTEATQTPNLGPFLLLPLSAGPALLVSKPVAPWLLALALLFGLAAGLTQALSEGRRGPLRTLLSAPSVNRSAAATPPAGR